MWHPLVTIVSFYLIAECSSFKPLIKLDPLQLGASAKSLFKYDVSPKSQPLTWTGGYFVWPCKSTKNMYKASGKYIHKNIIATRAQAYGDDVFLVLPRYRSGIPVTLAKVSLKSVAGYEPYLEPFPSWDMQDEGKADSLHSVVDIFLDCNNILWALDIGVVNTLETPEKQAPAKIVAFSARTGNVLRTISLEGLVTSSSRLQYLVVDYSPDGRCYVYISDAANRAILVYDVLASRGFRVILPKAVTQGCDKRDVLYIALIHKPDESAVLFFTYLGGDQLFSIPTKHLQSGDCKEGITDVGCKPKRLVIIGTDNGWSLFFRYEGHSEVYRWDTDTVFDPSNFRVVHKSDTCQLATHAFADYRAKRIRVLESNFPDYIQGYIGCGAVQQICLMEGCI